MKRRIAGWCWLMGLSAIVALGQTIPSAIAPDLQLQVNGGTTETPALVQRGEPLIVWVTLRHPAQLGDEATRAATVASSPAKGKWTDALVFTLNSPPPASPSVLPLELVGDGGRELRLTADRVITLVYRLPTNARGNLPEGTYQLTARLSGQGTAGFSGVVEIAGAFKLIEPPGNIAGPVLAERQRWRVEDAVLTSRGLRGTALTQALVPAVAAANELLKAQPELPLAWVLEARVHEALGQPRRAVLFAGSAVGAWRKQHPEAKQTPFELLELEQRLAVLAADAPATPPSSPSTPPAPSVAAAAITTAARTPSSVAATESQLTPTRSPAPIPGASPEDAQYVNDSRGQWAVSAQASSEHGTKTSSAAQMIGPPNIPRYGDYGEAWTSKTPDAPEEWVRLAYAHPVRATSVRVRQNFNPGTVVKVEVLAADGQTVVVWSGHDTTAYPKNQIAWFVAEFAPPPFPVQSIQLTLDNASVKGWNEIDAVQLVGDP